MQALPFLLQGNLKLLKIRGLSKREVTSIYLKSKNSYSGRSPSNVLIRRQRPGALVRKGRPTRASIEGRHFFRRR